MQPVQRFALIAIVDDDPDVRASLDALMRSAGHGARCFARARDLLGDLTADALSCIVTDVHMPEMSGLELQREMARRHWLQPLIMMTAYPTDEARDEALGHGARAFLSKPIDPDALLAAIEGAIHPRP